MHMCVSVFKQADMTQTPHNVHNIPAVIKPLHSTSGLNGPGSQEHLQNILLQMIC